MQQLTCSKARRHFEHFLRAKDYTPSDILILKEKAEDQKKILKSGQDARVLKEAMSAFQSLQHVQILRLQGEEDRRLLDYARENRLEFEPDVGEPALVDLRWSLACYHATKTMGEALSHAQSPFNRFSGPMMNPHSALAIHKEFPQTTTSLASSLTCLELHFEDGLNLNEKMLELRDLFKAVFSAATNLQALHIGFPSRTPLDMRLEDIFHNVHWEKLRAVGIQAWYLDADEIINLARRHSQTLRGLRLRDVLLRDGSLWKDVLEMLRAEMEQLDWVSLRRIDYSKHFDELWAGSMEVPDDLPAAASDSDDEDEFPTHVRDFAHDAESEGGDSDGYSDADTDQGPDANEFALSPDTPVSLPFCTCSRSSYPASADDLGDNGRFVDYPQRKMWEKWVLALCPEHYYK
ncbi:hypothetical protein MMC28_003792 [Mycoblastus sanguinarius]|nr:hypothetical protein [Mycoblastus sanguinarius]